MLLIGMLPNGNIANIIKRGSCDKKKEKLFARRVNFISNTHF